MNTCLKSVLAGSVSVLALTTGALARDFDVPSGDLKEALNIYANQARVALIVSGDVIRGAHTKGAKGDFSAEAALARILDGTGFTARRTESGAIGVVRLEEVKATHAASDSTAIAETPTRLAAASNVETVVVTSSKIKGDIQTVPIAITALSQEQLTSRQIAGGPDLVKEVPNLTFSKTNFTGYNIEIRGIGTQAISVTTDPAVAVAFNDTPFIRNHFFEQEFFDVSQVEVLRGPQGTLYGRNATAGVVNVVSAKPTDEFEAALSADWGNYHNRRYEGMVNLPIVDDRLGLRIAGEWTKRDGYSFNQTTGQPIDGRDLWSVRATLGWKPVSSVQTYLIWEHFSESDDRLRSGKQLCHTDPGLSSINGVPLRDPANTFDLPFTMTSASFSQGCLPAGLYSKDSYEVPNGFSLPFISGASFEGFINSGIDPYSQTTQSTDLRKIQSAIEPRYLAKNDTLELNASWNITPSLTFSSDTGYNHDFLWSTEDFNRFDTAPGIFRADSGRAYLVPNGYYTCYLSHDYVNDPAQCVGQGAIPAATFCDHQLGCSDRLVVQDLSTEHAWQFNQEFRLASSFEGPINFSAGGNYMHYETLEKYYVFSNTFTMISMNEVNCSDYYVQNVTDHLYCLNNGQSYVPPQQGGGIPTESPQYLDPNPMSSLNDEGHNYFLSKNPYVLNSYAAFGEAYYNVTPDLKLTGGLRWTDDEKHFIEYPSQVLTQGYGYPSTGTVDQKWKKYTGRAVANWTPKLDFTDQSMFYASYAHGYKAGGANPPGAVLLQYTNTIKFPIHPLTFKPEYIDAYEIGTKNTLLDGALTLNGDAFFYNYKGYQISQIVDRTSINLNFDATVRGAEIEATYEPLPGLKLAFAGGYEDTRIKDGQGAIDLMDRTAGHPGWVVMKPWAGQASNCIFPDYVAAAIAQYWSGGGQGNPGPQACGFAYNAGLDPITEGVYHDSWNGAADPSRNLVPGQPYYSITDTFSGTTYGGYPFNIPANTIYLCGFGGCGVNVPAISYPGFDPTTAPNNGEGFAKPVGGNELPNAPHFTTSFTADYTMPVSANWAATLHGDFYWQSQSWARVFNDRPYDKIRGYSNVNLALILTDASGWQVMGYVKNIFDATAITGDFLNSDDTGLTTNVFLTDPRLFGVRVTKHFDAGDLPGGTFDLLTPGGDTKPQFWLTLGGNYNMNLYASTDPYDPLAAANFPNGGNPTPPWPSTLPTPAQLQKTPGSGFDWQGALTYQPEGSDWKLKAGIRYGRSFHNNTFHESVNAGTKSGISFFGRYYSCAFFNQLATINPKYGTIAQLCYHGNLKEFDDSVNRSTEHHTILDFTLGKDVGLGSFNGTVAAGVRVAQFNSNAMLHLGAGPHYNLDVNVFAKYHELYEFASTDNRSFHGIGPELTWDGSNRLFGGESEGEVTLDWGVNAAMLFGKQSAIFSHVVKHCRVDGFGTLSVCEGGTISGVADPRIVEPTDNVNRSHNVTVPNLGGYAGLSVKYHDAKVSLGYRADTFFNAIDGGQYAVDKKDRGFYGPYFNISLGLGG